MQGVICRPFQSRKTSPARAVYYERARAKSFYTGTAYSFLLLLYPEKLYTKKRESGSRDPLSLSVVYRSSGKGKLSLIGTRPGLYVGVHAGAWLGVLSVIRYGPAVLAAVGVDLGVVCFPLGLLESRFLQRVV